MKVVRISKNNEWNYLKNDGSYLLDEHVNMCLNFNKGLGIVFYYDNTRNFVNSEGKTLLKNNVYNCWIFNKGFAKIEINNIYYYYIDKKCNFYNQDKVSFKKLYHEYPNMRSELIEIIQKYTYHDIDEYFNI